MAVASYYPMLFGFAGGLQRDVIGPKVTGLSSDGSRNMVES